jgi:hypothetical protein
MNNQRYWQRESLKNPDRLTAEINGHPWHPQKGIFRLLCWLLGCEEVVRADTTQRVDYGDLLDNTPPKPKPGSVFVEQKATLHHISANYIRLLWCRRCGAEWYVVDPIRDEPPLEYSTWLELPIHGGFVPPAEPKPESQSELTLWQHLKKS